MMLLLALFAPWAAKAQTLTVCDGTVTNSYIPIYGYWADAAQHNQMIYPASELTDMVGMSIDAMKFYLNSGATGNNIGSWTIKFGETTATTLSGLDETTTLTQVYSGAMTFDATNMTMSMVFDNGYVYNGGNLLVDFTHSAASYRSMSFFGIEATSAAVYQYSSYSANVQNFLPKNTFTYSVPATCSKPTGLAAALTEGDGTVATLSWTENGTASTWQICLNGDETNLIAATTNPWPLTGLTPETAYTAKVRAYCSADDQSEWSNEVTFKPTNAISLTVNDGTNTNGYVPIYGFYVDAITKSQFIIPGRVLADMAWGTINKMTFYAAADKDWENAQFEVYMTETSETTLTELADYSTMTKVMNAASLGISGNQMVVEFDTPYQYGGGNLMIGFLQTVTGTYSSCSWYGEAADAGSSWGGYGTSVNAQSFLPKTTFGYIPGEAPSCMWPTNLAVSNIGARSVELSWTENGEATAWQIGYQVVGGTEQYVEVSTNPYTLTGLRPETDYQVRVQSKCSDTEYSVFTEFVDFTTDVACHAPTNVAVSDVEPFAATVSWNGTANNYNLRYRATRGFNYGFETAEGFVVDQFPPCTTYDGDGLPTYGITGFTMPNNTGNYVGSVVSFNEYWATHSGNVMGVFMDAIPDSDAGITANDDYFITPALTIAAGDHFQFWARSVTDSYGLERMKVGIYGGNGTISTYFAGSADTYVEVPVAWTKYDYDLTAYVGQTIQLAINCVSADAFALLFDDLFVGDPTDDTWDVTLNNVTSPYTLTGLSDETDYEVQVQAACGGQDGVSAWTTVASFTTPSNCAAPTNLAANNITYNAATLSWNGFHDTYNVQYRTAESRVTYYFNDFNDEETEGWTRDYFIYGFTDPIYNVDGDDNYFLEMGWNSTEEETLISCELPAYESGAHVEFYYSGYQTANTFQVGFSTTTNDADAFTWSDPIDAPLSTYTLYNEELAAGVKYVAWKATASEQAAAVFIDNFGIFGETIPASEWQTLNAVTTPYALTELADETEYEWQVQGINPACEGGATPWSHMATFTTPNACQVPVIDSVANVEATTATVYWTGAQYAYNVRYGAFEPYSLITFDDEEIPADWTNDTLYAWALTDTLTDGGYCIRSTNQGVASTTSTISFSANFEAAGVISFDAMFMGEGTSTAWDKCIFSIDDNQQFSYGAIGQNWYNMAFYFAAGRHTFTWTYSKDSSVNPTGDFFAIDNIKIQLQGDTWTTVENVTGNSYNMTGLTPDAVIAVQVQGNNDLCENGVTEWSEEYLFITPAAEGQTLELSEGWNWVSIYLDNEDPEEMMLMLQEALGEHGLTIAAADDYTTYADGEWGDEGDLEELSNDRMYMIEVAESCTVVLQGMPADPADYTITIVPGWNWIGFPSAEAISIEDAFADFEAEDDDMIVCPFGYTTFVDEWGDEGELEELTPGVGYMYFYHGEEAQDLIIQTGDKARRVMSSMHKPLNLKVKAVVPVSDPSKTAKVEQFKTKK